MLLSSVSVAADPIVESYSTDPEAPPLLSTFKVYAIKSGVYSFIEKFFLSDCLKSPVILDNIESNLERFLTGTDSGSNTAVKKGCNPPRTRLLGKESNKILAVFL